MINEYQLHSFCKDDISLIENYEAAINDTETWVCHHRLELTLNNEFAHSRDELKRLNMYYKRPYFELILMKRSDHARLHGLHISDNTRNKLSIALTNKVVSEETRTKLSLALTGKSKSKPVWNKGMKNCSHHTEEAKAKISAAHKGKCKHNLGKHWKLVDGKRVWY